MPIPMPDLCLDTFFINMLGHLKCTVRLEDKSAIDAAFGITTFDKVVLYTLGSDIDPDHANFGFRAVLDPPPQIVDPNNPGNMIANPDFPMAVTITGDFDGSIDVSGNADMMKKITYSGVITLDRSLYPAQGGISPVKVNIIFNPGID